ncbi:radical SAM family heme chaperone HemW [Microaerobacter geothermalis]|uniref:radical SAM family heme chaperone HemW n=1 Tax=Microaerobacter geothermalis TaxID=674972 RepID=UPI001F430573|nr:radical SAM family heme chaperone HemW [Microaerobacter geothermalis]MCF6092867.1 radical SAM family heme chaperone HemW [Microaerobacter geothermalis]
MVHSVYIHIPFCTNKCFYCDFNSYVTRDEKLVWDYLYALRKEMNITVNQSPPSEIKTIFVGGGTPSILNPEQMEFFLLSVQEFFPRVQSAEYTIEANPGTLTKEKLTVMKKGGVNRLSLGVQSFQNVLLKELGRIHDRDQVFESIRLARQLGFENLSIDLMFGLPNQTMSQWIETLEIAFSLNLAHYSAYSLKVEPNTRYHVLYERGELPLPPEDEEVNMYITLIERMNHCGYHQYEISNFAKPGFECKHNLTYWQNEEYYGIGAGAHGYMNGQRHVNVGPVSEYIHQVNRDVLPRIETFSVSKREAMEETMFMGLRMLKGVSSEDFRKKHDIEMEKVFDRQIKKLITEGLLEKNEERVWLTKKGVLFGNEVFAHFIEKS